MLDTLSAIFGDRLYVELQRHGLAEERAAEEHADRPSPMTRALPLVATNDVHFGTADMYEAHDALLCIADRRLCLAGRPPAAHARAPLQDPPPR